MKNGDEIRFEWDGENISHLARHRIKASEAEEVFRKDPVIRSHDVAYGEDRWTAAGATAPLRILVMVFTMRGEKIRLITGWDADKRTKKEYFLERGS